MAQAVFFTLKIAQDYIASDSVERTERQSEKCIALRVPTIEKV